MTKIVATFSNGHTDQYNGQRAVKAAWMIILPQGKLLSGHSNDLPTAEKTARTKAAECFNCEGFHYQSLKAMAKWAHAMPRVREILKQTGFKSVKEHDAALAAARAAFVAKCKIEVVAL